jgi:hypothetical protein
MKQLTPQHISQTTNYNTQHYLPKPFGFGVFTSLRGGVCEKFNLNNCCLQLSNEGKLIKEITNKMKKLAHVPVQTWKGWSPNDLFGGWLTKILIVATFLILEACLILPCLTPLVY